MKQITTFILLLALCVCTDAAAQRSVRLTVLEKRDGTAGHSR